MIFTVVALLFLAGLLLTNYAKDKGSYTRDKVVHALALAYVVLLNAGAFKTVASQVRDFSDFKAYYSVPLGFLPAQLNFISTFLASIFDLVLFLAAFKVAQRSAIAVLIFRIVLVASIPTGLIGFYRGFLSTNVGTSDHAILLIAAIVIGTIKLGLFFLYGSRFMQEFLRSPAGIAKTGYS